MEFKKKHNGRTNCCFCQNSIKGSDYIQTTVRKNGWLFSICLECAMRIKDEL